MAKKHAQINSFKSDENKQVSIVEGAADFNLSSDLELLEATHVGNLKIGNASIGCAVLEDGTRLLTQSSFMRAIGRAGRPRKRTSFIQDEMPEFLSASNLEPFITDEMRQSWIPVAYKVKGRAGRPGYGYRAELLAQVCNVYLDALEAGKLVPNQMAIARQCQILIRGFAQVGIIALVDEATGYQEERDRDALHRILEAYIAKEFLPWTKRFPDEFYQEMFRLHGWQYSPMNPRKGPRYAGKITNEIVYEKLPPGVLEELRKRNPIVRDGQRQHKHHTLLTPDIGNPHLEKHLAAVVALMRASPSWRHFKRLFARAFPDTKKPQQQELPFDDEWDDFE